MSIPFACTVGIALPPPSAVTPILGTPPATPQCLPDRKIRPMPPTHSALRAASPAAATPLRAPRRLASLHRRARAPPGPREGLSPPPREVVFVCSDDLPRWPERGPQAGEGDVMATLPAYPSLDQLRHQAKDLLRAAKSGDAAAAAQVTVVSDPPTLSAAQLVVARQYGFPSWPVLKAEVQARAASLDQLAAEFCVASVRDWTGKAVRLLAQTPEIAGHSLATALMLGDVARVRAEIARDPATATRSDPRTGWTPLHAVCASRWHFLDPDRAPGLVATARLLLDAGADLNVRLGNGRTPFNCATASASGGVGHEALMRLLLERGAVPEDHDL